MASALGEVATTPVATTADIVRIHLPSSTVVATSTSPASLVPTPAALHAVSPSPVVTASSAKHHPSVHVKDLAAATSAIVTPEPALPDATPTTLQLDLRTTLTVEPTATPVTTGPGTLVYKAAASFSTLSPVSALTRTYDTYSAATSSAVPLPNPDLETDNIVTEDSTSKRKTLLIASLLTLSTLSALGLFLLCLRYKVFARIRHRRKRGSYFDQGAFAEEGFRGRSTPTKEQKHVAFNLPGSGDHVTLPTVSSGMHAPSGSPPPQIPPASYSPHGWHVFMDPRDGEYEDVTHILSPKAFEPRPGSIGSQDSAIQGGRTSRTSGGGASLSAESYATCESRYSSPSVPRESQEALLESASMVFADRSQTVSPPASPFVATPKASACEFGASSIPAKAQNQVILDNLAMMSLASQDLSSTSAWELELANAASHETSGSLEKLATVELGSRTCVLMHAV
ncbi:hypothetical protein CERSUDRAFT_98645 [Gelatoporia subvermispora B]|uniref:Uncharacterized protein n=1 Tax=Ceriporiopsis subvermispora (strain B) TaxID=914234 RepID=M2Q9K5_CERS8|nr:hypothetical protein CERSUDRAFT_98645 [Gelatoporia subvermispora B]